MRRKLRMAPLALALAVSVSGCGDAGPRDPATHLARVLAEPDPFERTAALSTFLASWGGGASASFPALLQDARLDPGLAEYALLVRYWATHRPREAALWTLSGGPPARRSAAIEVAWESWARADPPAAARALREASGRPPDLAVAERGLLRGWLAAGGAGLEAFIRDAGVGVPRQRMLAHYAFHRIREEGPEAAVRFAASVPPDDAAWRRDVLRQVAVALATRHPQAAADWCARVCDEVEGLRALVAQRWAARDGRAALEWAARGPSARERQPALRTALRGWLRSDPEGVARWMQEQVSSAAPHPAWLDPLLAAYAGLLAAGDPQEALGWTAQVSDAEARRRARAAVFGHWRRRDEPAALGWLERADLSPAERARLRDAGTEPQDS